MLRVRRDRSQCFGCGPEEDAIDHLLVLVGDGGNLFRHGKDHVKVGDLQKFGLTILDPLRPRQRLALWAMPVPAGVVTVPLIAALIATFEVAA